MKVLLSIKPIFAESIFNRTKFYEFRKTIFKKPNVDKVIVYASSPIKMILGEFDIGEIFQGSPEQIWEKTQKQAGISRQYFFNYFAGRNIGYAIRINDVLRYQKPLNLKEEFNIIPPQSFCYLTE